MLTYGSTRINLANVYVPTYPTERGIFFRSFFLNSRLILPGDFNCYDGHLDKLGGLVSIDVRLTDLKSVHFLRDAWRLKHPSDR